MRLQNNTISNSHHSLIFLDVDGAINTSFSHKSDEEKSNINFSEETIGKELVTFFLTNKEELDNLVIYDDINGKVAQIFSNNYLLVDTLANFDDEIYQKIQDIVIE